MKENFILKAEKLLREGRVKLDTSSSNFEAQVFYFKILSPRNDFPVIKDEKGWRCGYISKNNKWSCTLNIGKITCNHIIACMAIVNDVHIRELVRSNTSFKEAVKLGRSMALNRPENARVEVEECLDRFHHSGVSIPANIIKQEGK